MFDKLEDLLIRFEEIMGELHEPTVTNNHLSWMRIQSTKSASRILKILFPCWKRKKTKKCAR